VTTHDDLLFALDQLTTTVYWCRRRGMTATAGSAILEAVGDWLDNQDRTRGHDVPSVTADDDFVADPLATAFDRLGRYMQARSSEDTVHSVTEALTEAINDWTAAVSVEHHRSTPFDRDTREATQTAALCDSGTSSLASSRSC
jgi:hypothetical protein